MALSEQPGSSDTLAAPPRREPRAVIGAWTSTALAAALHAAVLAAGAQAAGAAPEPDEREVIEEIRRYLAASEQRTAAAAPVALASQRRVDNQLAEGQHGRSHGGDEAGPEGTES